MKNGGCFIGVDGGGSHSKAVLVDENLRILRRTEGDCLNYFSISFESARDNFHALINQLLDGMDRTCVRGMFIGMSALDAEERGKLVEDFAGGLCPDADIYMHSDLYIALMSLTLGAPGIILVSGTGTMALAVDEQGKEYTVGGYGYLLGDQGSAYSIAESALRTALMAFDGVGEQTALQSAMLTHFALDNHRNIIDKVYTSSNPRKYISTFAVEVSRAASNGDPSAMNILKRNAKYLSDVTISLIRKMDASSPRRIGVYGGVFENDSIVNKFYEEFIHRTYPDVRIETLRVPSEIGAAIAAMKRSGICIKQEMLNNIKGE